MEKFIHNYIKNVKKCIILNSKEEKQFIREFTRDLSIAYNNKEFSNIIELNEIFGYPNEVAAAYIKTISCLEISKYMKSRRAIIAFIIALTLSIICIYSFKNFRLNQLINEANLYYQNNSTH